MRITTNAILRSYGSNLNKSANSLNAARERALTGKKYQRASEDPSSATKAFKLRRDYLKNEDYISNAATASTLLTSQESSLMQINSMTQTAKENILRGLSETMDDTGRTAIAQSLRETAESMIMTLNTKVGDRYLFGGASTKEPPFAIDGGTVTYRGLDVSDPAVQAELEALSKENSYIDLGFGIKTDDAGNIIKGTAYDTSRPGINSLGFGQNEDGLDQNMAVLLLKMADEFEKNPIDTDLIGNMSSQLDKSANKNLQDITQMGVDSKFLEDTESRLTDGRLNLNERLVAEENIDLALAITEFSWAEFAYSAALKVGNSILSQSFIDFMR